MSSKNRVRSRYVGASMRLVWQWVWARNHEAAVRAGFDDLNPAHLGLFQHPSPDGRRLTDIAEQMQISKQSVHELVVHLEKCGYLVRVPDPSDRRARIVQLTERGERLGAVIRREARRSEQTIAKILGPSRMRAFKEALELIIAEVAPTDSPAA